MVQRRKDKHEKLSLEAIANDTSVDALIRVLCRKVQELPYSKKLIAIFYLKHLIYNECDTIIIPKSLISEKHEVKDLGDGYVEVRK